MHKSCLLCGLLLAALTSTAMTSAALADIPVLGQREITPMLQFENLGDYPDWTFFVQYRRGHGNPYAAPVTLVPVTPGQEVPVAGSGRRLAELQLVAVPREQASDNVGNDNAGGKAEATAASLPGALVASLSNVDVTTTDGSAVRTYGYTVVLNPGKLEVQEKWAREAAPLASTGSRTAITWILGLAIAAAVIAVGVVGIVVMCVWKLQKRAPATIAAASPAEAPAP